MTSSFRPEYNLNFRANILKVQKVSLNLFLEKSHLLMACSVAGPREPLSNTPSRTFHSLLIREQVSKLSRLGVAIEIKKTQRYREIQEV